MATYGKKKRSILPKFSTLRDSTSTSDSSSKKEREKKKEKARKRGKFKSLSDNPRITLRSNVPPNAFVKVSLTNKRVKVR